MSHFSIAVISEKPEDVERLLAPYQENNMGDCPKEYLVFTEDPDCDVDSETGERGYWINPNSKWDWWEIGGRFSGAIPTLQSKNVDQCQIKDVNTELNLQAYKEAARFWEVNVEKDELHEGERAEEFFTIYNKNYYLDRYGTKEKFARMCAKLSTFALVTPDGKWHEQGKAGWFGFNSATKESMENYLSYLEEVLKSTDPEFYITVVDAHI